MYSTVIIWIDHLNHGLFFFGFFSAFSAKKIVSSSAGLGSAVSAFPLTKGPGLQPQPARSAPSPPNTSSVDDGFFQSGDLSCLSSGGHPHNWNALSSECLSLLADLTQRLVAHHDTVAINGRAKLHSAGSDKKSVSSDSSGTTTRNISFCALRQCRVSNRLQRCYERCVSQSSYTANANRKLCCPMRHHETRKGRKPWAVISCMNSITP